jgi:hypothetical protein
VAARARSSDDSVSIVTAIGSKLDFRGGIILLAEGGASGRNLRVVLAPDRQRRRQMCPKLGMEVGTQPHIGCIVAKEVDLDIVVSRSVE